MANLLDKVLQQAQTPVNIRSIEDSLTIPVSIAQAAAIDNDPLIADALNRIRADYGVTVSVASKAKSLLKFGRNPNVLTTPSTIWYTGQDQANETYVADNVNSIDSVSAANPADTGIQIGIEGHTMTGGNRTFVTQFVTLLGQTRVPLPEPLNRSTRLYNNSSTNLVGEVYIYENTAISGGKPTDTTKIHLTVRAGRNQSEKASTSLSSTDYWIVTGFRGSILEKSVNIFADLDLEVRQVGKVFRQVEDVSISTISVPYLFLPYLIVPANADVRLVAVASAGGTDITGSIQGYLAN